MSTIVALVDFRDRDDFSVLYEKGSTIVGFDAERIKDLVKRGFVAEVEDTEEEEAQQPKKKGGKRKAEKAD